jgi:hypothetical protein
VEYIVQGWKDGAGDPITIYRGQLTSCVATTEMLCRGHTHQVAVCACASGATGEPSQRAPVPHQIRIRLPSHPQHQQAGGGGGDVSQALREQEEAARRAAEESHRRTQLRTTLSAIQPPLVEYSEDGGVVRVSWQPVVVVGGDEVEYIVQGWKDGAGDPITIYRGQLTSCVATTEMLCRGHTHQVAVCACASGATGEPSQRAPVPHQIRIRLPSHPQQQQAGGGGGDVSQALREQEEAARRAAEESHRRTQLRTTLSAIQPPLVCTVYV